MTMLVLLQRVHHAPILLMHVRYAPILLILPPVPHHPVRNGIKVSTLPRRAVVEFQVLSGRYEGRVCVAHQRLPQVVDAVERVLEVRVVLVAVRVQHVEEGGGDDVGADALLCMLVWTA